MQTDALEAALRLIIGGPADQPLMRILRIAANFANCSASFIGVRRDDGFQIIASHGIPFTQYRSVLPRAETIAAGGQQSGTIDSLLDHPELSEHPFVAGPPHWRYVSFATLPLPALANDVVLYVADPRLDHERPSDLIKRLEECASIAADELRMIGEIALQSETVTNIRSEVGALADAVQKSSPRVALVGSDFLVRAVSASFADLGETPAEDQVGRSIFDVQRGLDEGYADCLRDVLATGEPLFGLAVQSYDQQRNYELDAFRCESNDGSNKFLVVMLREPAENFRRGESGAFVAGDTPGVVSEFLLSTLIEQKRLLRRGPVAYHALYRWRSTVKDAQIAALKALKRDPGDAFLDAVAEKMSAGAGALFGTGTFRAVVPVPCGNSGENCLSMRLAQLIAVRLGVDFIDAFEPQPRTGGSHPKSNLRRAAMRLKVKPKVPVLLIDDVATSGAHIEEAALSLRRTAPAVLPLVWIAD